MRFICKVHGDVKPKEILYSYPAQAFCPECRRKLEDVESNLQIGRGYKYLLTHGSKAHLDDFLSCCLSICAFHIRLIKRGNPDSKELEDPDVLVLDIGKEYNKEKSNFDHHQWSYDNPKENWHLTTCTLTLILKEISIYEKGRLYWKWLKSAEIYDCTGPFNLSEIHRISFSTLKALQSPIEIAMLQIFSDCKEIKIGEPLYDMMKLIGEKLISNLESRCKTDSFFVQHGKQKKIEKDSSYFLMERTEDYKPDFPIHDFLWEYLDTIGKDIPIAVYPNDRKSKGYKLYRRNDDVRVNFKDFPDDERIDFVHSNGFLISTKENDLSLVEEIIKKCFSETARNKQVDTSIVYYDEADTSTFFACQGEGV